MTTPLARSTDPKTSHDSAPPRAKREEQKLAILALLTEHGPMTDHELTWKYNKLRHRKGWPATQADGVRKRRSELKNEGRVVDTGAVSGFAGSRSSTVWAAAS